jgi:hypothetical protein
MRTPVAAALAALVSASSSVDPGWSRVAMRTAALAADGFVGGEGCQVVRSLGISRADPSFLLLGADVGGLWRSLDGAQTWHPAMVGWNSRGATGFAFDSTNASRALGIGGNSGGAAGANGVHVTADKGSSWDFTLPLADPIACLDGSAVVYDPSSYSSAAGGLTRAYYASVGAGLWRSDDAGRTWRLIDASLAGGACLAADSTGRLYAALADRGVYGCGAGYNGGGSGCALLVGGNATGLDIPSAAGDADPDTVYVSGLWGEGGAGRGTAAVAPGPGGILRSTDGGATWTPIPTAGTPWASYPLHHVAVSPANASLVSVWWVVGPYYNTTKAVSRDGGATFSVSRDDTTDFFFADNARDGKPVWHPTDAAGLLFNAGGDMVTVSTDETILVQRWAGNGYNAVMTGGLFAFSPLSPNATFLSFQDYAGASTQDGGRTWARSNVTGYSWGGSVYGGFALTPSAMWAGNAGSSWTAPRNLTVSFDAGLTWAPARDSSSGAQIVFGGGDASLGHPQDATVGFASDWRTGDGGRTWVRMAGCTGVLAYDADPAAQAPARLFGVAAAAAAAGADGGSEASSPKTAVVVVVSGDKGLTWTPLGQVTGGRGGGGEILDLACDYASAALYVVAGRELFRCTGGGGGSSPLPWSCESLAALLPQDQTNHSITRSVAVDPVDPSVVYASMAADLYLASVAVVRSVDSGRTWASLTLSLPLDQAPGAPLQGPHEVTTVRVHPSTREVWAGGSCFGVWKAPAPAAARE